MSYILDNLRHNRFLLGVCVVLIPLLTVITHYGITFVSVTNERNNDIKHIERSVSDMRSDIKDIHWHLVGAREVAYVDKDID